MFHRGKMLLKSYEKDTKNYGGNVYGEKKEKRRKEIKTLGMILGLVLCLGMWNGEVRAGTNTNVTVNSYIEDSIHDRSNVYYFQLSSPGKVQVELKHDINAWYDVYIDEVNSEGVINNWYKYWIESEATTIDGTITQHSGAARLPVGKYRVRIADNKFHYGKAYKIKINYKAEGDGYEKQPNGTAQYATSLVLNSPIIGNLSDRDDVDYYKIQLSKAGNVKLKMVYDKTSTYMIDLYKPLSNGALEKLETIKFGTDSSFIGDYATKYSDIYYLDSRVYYIRCYCYSPYYYSNDDYTLTAQYSEPYISVQSLSLSRTSISTAPKKSFKLSASIYPSNANKKVSDITWRSNKTSVASVDKNGNVKAKTPGKTTITASVDGKTAKCVVTVKPGDVKNLKLKKKSSSSITVKWSKVSNAAGYEIYMSTKKNSGYKKISTIKKNKITVYTKKNLKRGKNYYFKIRSYKNNGGKVYGSWSKVRSLRLK